MAHGTSRGKGVTGKPLGRAALCSPCRATTRLPPQVTQVGPPLLGAAVPRYLAFAALGEVTKATRAQTGVYLAKPERAKRLFTGTRSGSRTTTRAQVGHFLADYLLTARAAFSKSSSRGGATVAFASLHPIHAVLVCQAALST